MAKCTPESERTHNKINPLLYIITAVYNSHFTPPPPPHCGEEKCMENGLQKDFITGENTIDVKYRPPHNYVYSYIGHCFLCRNIQGTLISLAGHLVGIVQIVKDVSLTGHWQRFL